MRSSCWLKYRDWEENVELACYIVVNKATIRQTASEFGISKSSVHYKVTERLEKINPNLAKEVRTVLDENKALRHIRGGEATKRKYLKLKNK